MLSKVWLYNMFITLSYSFSVVIEFQTASSEAVLLYLQGSVHADFVALELRAGILTFSYNLGSGRIDIQSESNYDDGEIHMVRRLIFFSA